MLEAMNPTETVNLPLLIIHGGEDEEVPVSQALTSATKPSTLHKPYELWCTPTKFMKP